MLDSFLRRHLYLGAVVGLASSNDPESYAGVSVASGRACHAAQVKVDEVNKRDNLALQVGSWAWGLKLHPVKFLTVEKLLTIEAGQTHLRRKKF